MINGANGELPPNLTPSVENLTEKALDPSRIYWDYTLQHIAKELNDKKRFNFYHFQEYINQSRQHIPVTDETLKQILEQGNSPFAANRDLEDLADSLLNQDKFQKSSEWANTGMDVVFGTCSAITVGTAIAALFFPGSQLLTLLAAGASIAWNYFDSGGGVIDALDKQKKKQIIACIAIATASAALVACNTAYILSLPTIHIIAGSLGTGLATAGAAVGAGLAGAAFAACMFTACGVELYQVKQGYKRLATLADEYQKLKAQESPPSTEAGATDTEIRPAAPPQSIQNPNLSVKKIACYNAMLTEKACIDQHKRSAVVWGACGIGMTAAAVIGTLMVAGTIGAGVASFGVVPAVIALVCVGIGIWRYYQNKKELKVEGLKKIGETVSDIEVTKATTQRTPWHGGLFSFKEKTAPTLETSEPRPLSLQQD
jgi:hypothetical protein